MNIYLQDTLWQAKIKKSELWKWQVFTYILLLQYSLSNRKYIQQCSVKIYTLSEEHFDIFWLWRSEFGVTLPQYKGSKQSKYFCSISVFLLGVNVFAY